MVDPSSSRESSPPAFAWEDWYAAVGGRSINIDEVSTYLKKIYDDQYHRFDGPVAPVRLDFASVEESTAALKSSA